MTVLWLCVQSTVLSATTVGMICMVDSFWTVAARSLRVVFWWGRQLLVFYMTSSTFLSIARPHASLWSFVMMGGILLGLAAVVTDQREVLDAPEDKLLLSSERNAATKGVGMGKYV